MYAFVTLSIIVI